MRLTLTLRIFLIAQIFFSFHVLLHAQPEAKKLTAEQSESRRFEYCISSSPYRSKNSVTEAIQRGKYEESKRLIRLCEGYLNYEGGIASASVISAAISASRSDLVSMLLTYGADSQQGEPSGWTVLHSAVADSKFKIVKSLLLYGADPMEKAPNIRGDHNEIVTPFDLAQRSEDKAIKNIFQKVKAASNRNNNKRSFLEPKLVEISNRDTGLDPDLEGFLLNPDFVGTYKAHFSYFFSGDKISVDIKLQFSEDGSVNYTQNEYDSHGYRSHFYCELGKITYKEKVVMVEGAICGVSGYTTADYSLNISGAKQFYKFNAKLISSTFFNTEVKTPLILEFIKR